MYLCVRLPSVTHRPHYSMSLALVASLPSVEKLDKSQYVKDVPGVMASTHKYMTARQRSAALWAGFSAIADNVQIFGKSLNTSKTSLRSYKVSQCSYKSTVYYIVHIEYISLIKWSACHGWFFFHLTVGIFSGPKMSLSDTQKGGG